MRKAKRQEIGHVELGPAATGRLRLQELFQGVPESRLAELEKKSEAQKFPAGHVFFQPGGTGEVLYFLESGRVETFRTSGNKRLVISQLTAPAVFGEMACVGQCLYHCAARSAETCRVRVISRREFDALIEEYPSVTRRLLDLISRRFVDVLLDLDATSFRQLIPRLACLLLERAEGDFVLNITHAEIAERLRVYRESATAALGELRNAGIVEVGRRKIRIVDRTRLERAARE